MPSHQSRITKANPPSQEGGVDSRQIRGPQVLGLQLGHPVPDRPHIGGGPQAYVRPDFGSARARQMCEDLKSNPGALHEVSIDLHGMFQNSGKALNKPDLPSHISYHVGTFNFQYGVPAFDFGMAFCHGGHRLLEACKKSMVGEYQKSAPVRETFEPEAQVGIEYQYRASIGFADKLLALETGLSAEELYEINPIPEEGLEFVGSRYSFFRTQLPLEHPGDSFKATYLRRAHHFFSLVDELVQDGGVENPEVRSVLSFSPSPPPQAEFEYARELKKTWKEKLQASSSAK